MKLLLLTALLALVVASQAAPSCLQKFNTCRLSAIAKRPGQCLDDLTSCATKSCTCMDLTTAAVHACVANTTSEINTCTTEFSQRYAQCVQSCTAVPDHNVPEVHVASTNFVNLFGLPSKCSICKDIVGFAESRGEDFACDSLNLADIVPGCDFLGPVCGLVLNEICSEILGHIADHTPLSSSAICKDAHFCKSSVLSTPTPNHQIASMVSLSKKGVTQFIQRHNKYASQFTTANCFVNPDAKSKSKKYTCMEQLTTPQASLLTASPATATTTTTTTTSTSSSSSSHSELALGVGIGVAAAFAVMAVVAAVVRFRRNRRVEPMLA